MANPKLKVGDPMPDFSSTRHDGTPIGSADLMGSRSILYFYPKDATPGCTTEACDFRDNMRRLNDTLGIAVYGVSPDSVASHQRFRDKYDLPFVLISDPEKVVHEAFGVWREKKNYGRTYTGVVRSTFVIDAEGRIEHVYDNVRAKGHVDRVLRDLA